VIRPAFDALVDSRLSLALGEPDAPTRAAIDREVDEALRSTIGEVTAWVPADAELIDRIAPWARDLVRGLHWRACQHVDRTSNIDVRSIMYRLADRPIDRALADEAVANIAFAWALTHDRVIDQLHGHQAHKRFAAHVLEQRAPWQVDVLLGYSIHLILEWLRLDPRTST
jgi:hypothetical protein